MTEPIEPIEPSARARFRALLSDLVEAHPELGTSELAELAGRSLPDEDRELVADFLTAEAHSILAWELHAHFNKTRQGIYAAIDLANPDAPPVADLAEERRESIFDRISQWREFVPSENRTRPLLQFNRAALLESAQFDATRVALHGWKMHLKTRLAERLPDDTALVADHFSPEQILALGESVKKEMTRGNLRLKIQPVRALSRPIAITRQADGRGPA